MLMAKMSTPAASIIISNHWKKFWLKPAHCDFIPLAKVDERINLMSICNALEFSRLIS